MSSPTLKKNVPAGRQDGGSGSIISEATDVHALDNGRSHSLATVPSDGQGELLPLDPTGHFDHACCTAATV